MKRQTRWSDSCRRHGSGFVAPVRFLLAATIVAVLLPGLTRAEQKSPQATIGKEVVGTEHPNVLFLLADQHNAKFLGCAAVVPVKTPNLDRLAHQGVRFTSAVTNNPICTPSRMCYFSGQYVHNHGYYGLSGPSPRGLPTVLGHFRTAGYKTAAVGKIHCPLGWIEADTDLCLEAYAELSSNGHSPYDDYLRRRGLDHLRDDGFLQEQGAAARAQTIDARPSRLSFEDSVEGWCVQEAMKFIDACGKQPWIMQVSFPRPHQAFTPAKEFWDLYPDDKIWLPPNADADLSLKAPHLRQQRQGENNTAAMLFEPRTYEALRIRRQHGYLACVSQVDHAVGQLLAFLDQKGLAENTIVVYTADHGDYGCEFGLLEKAPGICGDAVCRVPSIWRWPGHFKAEHVSPRIVESVDVAPTLCALAGAPPMPTADGQDLTPLLRGEDCQIHEIGVTEHPWSKAVLKGDWRLVYYPSGFFAAGSNRTSSFGELYDHANDPWETKNLYFEPRCRERVAEIERALLDWLVTTTRVQTTWPRIPPREKPAPPGPIPEEFFYHQEADGKLPWRDVKAMRALNYK